MWQLGNGELLAFGRIDGISMIPLLSIQLFIPSLTTFASKGLVTLLMIMVTEIVEFWQNSYLLNCLKGFLRLLLQRSVTQMSPFLRKHSLDGTFNTKSAYMAI